MNFGYSEQAALQMQLMPISKQRDQLLHSYYTDEEVIGEYGYRSRHLSHAKRALYHLS